MQQAGGAIQAVRVGNDATFLYLRIELSSPIADRHVELRCRTVTGDYVVSLGQGSTAFLYRLIDGSHVSQGPVAHTFGSTFLEAAVPLARLGLGYDEVSALNPRLVYCSISAYGHTGPDSHRPGFGLIAEAKSGIMAMVGSQGEAPPLLRIALGDMYTGSHAVSAICAALLGRVKSGRGQHIDLALYDCLMSMHEYAVQCYTLSNGREVPQQTGHDLPTSTLYGVFTAQDGHLAIAAQADEAWRALARHIGGEALAADARFADMAARNANRLELLPIVRAWTATRPVAQILAELDALDVPCAKVQDIAEVINDPQIAARGMLITQQHPKLGTIRMPNLPFHFSGFDMGVPDCAPSLGQHNREIAADLGFAPHEIDAMQRDGVLHSEN